MIKIELLIDKILNEIITLSKDYLPIIINENARVENYFSVVTLGIFNELKREKLILNYKFQHLIVENKRKHIDFLIELNDKCYLIELKHLAIDNDVKLKTQRNLNFYTSISESGKKVGIVGDLEKLENLKQNTSYGKISLAIISNSPSKELVNNKLEQLRKNKNNWNFDYKEVKEFKIGFIISKMI